MGRGEIGSREIGVWGIGKVGQSRGETGSNDQWKSHLVLQEYEKWIIGRLPAKNSMLSTHQLLPGEMEPFSKNIASNRKGH